MICIDPGAAGGLVASELAQGLGPNAIKMPDSERELCQFLLPLPNMEPVAYLEDLVKFAGTNMPSSRMAVYASNWGFVKGALTAFQYRIVLVPPKKWQAALGLGSAKGMSKTEWKNKLKQMAEQLYPNTKVTLATADALLIHEAARRGLLG